MANDTTSKTLEKMHKAVARIEKTESGIEDALDKQIKLDKKLNNLIDQQSDINKSTLEQLEQLSKQIEQIAAQASIESRKASHRFIAETIISILSIAVAAIAAFASVYALCQSLA